MSRAALNSFGKSVFSKMLPEYTRRFLNDQNYKFKYSLAQLNKTGHFNVNMGLIKNPLIENGVLDLEFLMDVGPLG